MADELSAGDTAWMLTATALVLFMTIPGLSLFYAGMVRSENVLSVLKQCFAITGLMSILWAFWGYSIAFDDGNAFMGGFGKLFLAGVTVDAMSGTIPETVFMTFQMTFAVITPALIVGAFAERMKFSAMLWFRGIWMTIVYAPITHWVWGGGWLGDYGILDFAGGTVVHINAGIAGIAGLAACIALGRRKGYPTTPMPPNNLGYTVIRSAAAAAISTRDGCDDCAPARVQARDPAAVARRAASLSPWPAARVAASTPENVSPAPVVSTGRTSSAGVWIASRPVWQTDPSAPKVAATVSPKRRASHSGRLRRGSSPPPAWAATWTISTSFTMRTSRAPRTSSGTGNAGAALSRRRHPRRAARSTRRRFSSRGTSCCSSTTGSPSSSSSGTWEWVTRVFAPEATAMVLAPVPSSTQMVAQPVGSSASPTRERSTPSARSRARAGAAKASAPTMPAIATTAPARRAA